MPRKASDEEEGIHAGEVVLKPERAGGEFPLITLKVVYLGGHPSKFLRLPGTVLEEKDEETGETEVKLSKDGWSGYDFAVKDSRGRKIKVNMTPDGRRFQMVTHYDHLVAFYNTRGPDGEGQFEFRGSPAEIQLFQAYRKAMKKKVDPDRGPAVLKQMGLDEE